MNRRAFLAKTTIAAAGLCTLPLMAQTDLTLDIWSDTERLLRHELLSDAFPHAYHHSGCGHVTFYSNRKLRVGDKMSLEHFVLPDGRRPYMGQPVRCAHCDVPVYPDDRELFHVEVK